jgi:rhamnogalacturonan endolyase
MTLLRHPCLSRHAAIAFLTLLLSGSPLCAANIARTAGQSPANAAVTVTDNGQSWVLDNGIVKATINKKSGTMSSLLYHGIDTMRSGGGYWEQTPQDAPQLTDTITIDPSTNGGARAEVAIKGVTGGTQMLTPGAPGGGTFCDMEIRYALGRGESGIYTYAIFTHPPSYPRGGVGAESRYITRLNQTFDWITVDKDRNMLEAAPTDWGTGVVVHAKEQRIMSKGVYKNSVEHKYSYSGVQYKTPAYGWSSTKDHIGIWFINPTIEYLSGGPTKLELDAHFGDNADPDPIILDYWEGGHYDTGARCNLAAGEQWTKVIGPIFVYVNSLDKPKPTSPAELATLAATAGNPTVPASWNDNATNLWHDALAQAKRQTAAWPYAWVNGVDYPHQEQRSTVIGQIVLNDPLAPKPASTRLPHLIVGLTHPDTNGLSWIHNAKYYQFWNDGTEDGKFTITKVRPGNYTLHALADGVLGDFAQADITVEAGKTLDLGKLEWKPVRYGKQLWDIGYSDRTGDKFFKGDPANNWLWGWNLRYALLFPNDITYTIGKSDYHKDWFFEEVPHATNLSFVNPEAKDPAKQRFGWVKAESLDQYPQTDQHGPWKIYGNGRTTVWTIKFNLKKPVQGDAFFRVALAGVNAISQLAVAVNGQSVGAIGDGSNADNPHLITTNSIRYNADKGLWQERTLKFNATLLKSGENEMTLTVPGGDLQSGVVWDYLRLELNEDGKSGNATLAPAGQ